MSTPYLVRMIKRIMTTILCERRIVAFVLSLIPVNSWVKIVARQIIAIGPHTINSKIMRECILLTFFEIVSMVYGLS